MKINARPDCFGNQAEPLLRGKPVDRCIDCELFDKCHKITASVSLLAISDALDLIVQNGLVDGRLKGFAELEEIADAAEGQK